MYNGGEGMNVLMLTVIAVIPLSLIAFLLIQSFTWWIKSFSRENNKYIEMEFPAGPSIDAQLIHMTQRYENITKWHELGVTYKISASAGVFPEPVQLAPWSARIGFSESSVTIQCPYCSDSVKLVVRQCPMAIFESGFFQEHPHLHQSLFWILARYVVRIVLIFSLLSLTPCLLLGLTPLMFISDSAVGAFVVFVSFVSLWLLFQVSIAAHFWRTMRKKSVAIRVTRGILKQMIHAGVNIQQHICEVIALNVAQESTGRCAKHGFRNPNRHLGEDGYVQSRVDRWSESGIPSFADIILFSPYS